MHSREDVCGWQPAKTVWQIMQMRADAVGTKNSSKVCANLYALRKTEHDH